MLKSYRYIKWWRRRRRIFDSSIFTGAKSNSFIYENTYAHSYTEYLSFIHWQHTDRYRAHSYAYTRAHQTHTSVCVFVYMCRNDWKKMKKKKRTAVFKPLVLSRSSNHQTIYCSSSKWCVSWCYFFFFFFFSAFIFIAVLSTTPIAFMLNVDFASVKPSVYISV